MLDVFHTFLEQTDDVVVFDAIVDFLPLPARNHQTHLPQAAQMMRDGRLADAHRVRQSSDAHLLR